MEMVGIVESNGSSSNELMFKLGVGVVMVLGDRELFVRKLCRGIKLLRLISGGD